MDLAHIIAQIASMSGRTLQCLATGRFTPRLHRRLRADTPVRAILAFENKTECQVLQYNMPSTRSTSRLGRMRFEVDRMA